MPNQISTLINGDAIATSISREDYNKWLDGDIDVTKPVRYGFVYVIDPIAKE